jgi:hypothetical protein
MQATDGEEDCSAEIDITDATQELHARGFIQKGDGGGCLSWGRQELSLGGVVIVVAHAEFCHGRGGGLECAEAV